jgi:hypothetical protein
MCRVMTGQAGPVTKYGSGDSTYHLVLRSHGRLFISLGKHDGLRSGSVERE